MLIVLIVFFLLFGALLQDGEAELAQLAFQFFFLAAAVLVAQGMELRGVVHVGEVSQFVVYTYITRELKRSAKNVGTPF